jgi:cardiolipin synthase
MPDWLTWHWFAGAAVIAIDLLATAHIALNKRDVQSAIGWVGMVWFVPVAGPVLYYLLGINRVERKAKRLRQLHPQPIGAQSSPADEPDAIPPSATNLSPLAQLVHALTGDRLLAGNTIRPLHSGTDAFAAMLHAIDGASQSVGLSTYIFNDDAAGKRFIDALGHATARGVAVRVLIDDIGARYSRPWTAVGPLRKAGVQVARFMPQLLPWHFHYANMRNHRKILVVDGKIGFTGGMNIQAAHAPSLHPKSPIADMHFRLEGPVVAHLRETFATDWEFRTGTALNGREWFPELAECGTASARGIRCGPDDGFMRLRAVYLGALASARSSVRIVTPYFLPDAALIAGLNVAALRGVKLDVVLPERNNLRLVQWACMGQIGQVLEHGCRVWLAPPPFDHTKLLIVDRTWVLFGSSNWDPRSFRLNFEFDVECYDPALAGPLDEQVAKTIGRSRELTPTDLLRRSLPAKLRDGAARLLSPYL